jgi:preprotein translocase subunit SecF
MTFEGNVGEKQIREVIAQEKFGISKNQIQIQSVVNDLSSTEHNEYIVYIPKNQDEMDKISSGAANDGEKAKKISDTIMAIKEELKSTLRVKEFLRQEFVGPSIGNRLRTQALYACFVALIGIVLYIAVRFDFKFAVAAIVALVHDVWITLTIFSVFQVEIDLPFIAAILTIIGYSLNDTIVISDRIRENIRLLRKKSYDELVNISINQSMSRTINTSVTTFIPVLVLFLFGGAILKNFALSLLIGVVVGTYSSIFVVSPIIIAWKKYDDKKAKHAA